MRHTRTQRVFAVALCLTLLAGCAADGSGRGGLPFSSGTMLGAGGGAALGGLVGAVGGGRNRGRNAVIGALIGAAVGGFAGSAIGRSLSAPDQAQAQQATAQVLSAPVPEATVTRAQRERRPVQVARPASSAWKSGAGQQTRGSATLVAVEPAPNAPDRQCRTVREVAYISGREVVQNTRYCEGADGSWEATT